mmetsp:Transcript_20207/g.65093  ORF Transcript_20207/g.65093 Transcript_20207/m.65093 type:complete len:281 (+) Transcript_20207:1339-2181(+)
MSLSKTVRNPPRHATYKAFSPVLEFAARATANAAAFGDRYFFSNNCNTECRPKREAATRGGSPPACGGASRSAARSESLLLDDSRMALTTSRFPAAHAATNTESPPKSSPSAVWAILANLDRSARNKVVASLEWCPLKAAKTADDATTPKPSFTAPTVGVAPASRSTLQTSFLSARAASARAVQRRPRPSTTVAFGVSITTFITAADEYRAANVCKVNFDSPREPSASTVPKGSLGSPFSSCATAPSSFATTAHASTRSIPNDSADLAASSPKRNVNDFL